MTRADRPNEYRVSSRWERGEDWSRQLISDARGAFQGRVDALTDAETKLDIYEHGVSL